MIDATIKVEHVPADAHPRITVSGLIRDEDKDRAEQLYVSLLGPDAAGTLDRSIEVPIPPGKYTSVGVAIDAGAFTGLHCNVLFPQQSEGCVVIQIPHQASRPQIIAGWDAASARVLDVQVLATDLGPDAGVGVRVVGQTAGGRTVWLMSGFVPSDRAGTGSLQDPIHVPVRDSVTTVCVAAKAFDHADAGMGFKALLPRCPPKGDEDTAWMRLNAPTS